LVSEVDGTSPAQPAIYFGIAGWSYPDWEGFVYPPHTKDKLAYVAPLVDVIEINSTFYRPPDARTAESWAVRTAEQPGFFFTAKLHQDITHGGRLDPATVDAFRKGLDPLVRRGRLKHLLAQFRYDYRDTPAAREHVRRIADAFAGMANLTFEFRHNSWQSPQALEYAASLKATVANLDYPTARDSFTLAACTVGEHAYFRLHGRNAQAWFSKGSGRDETYNHLYNEKELGEIKARAQKIAGMSRSLTMIANNHYQGKEMVNILQLKSMITGRKVAVPPLLAEKYPALAAIRES
jgi:uncharacterized protein YecE (DUF72 family)